jgi:hypothetical protein
MMAIKKPNVGIASNVGFYDKSVVIAIAPITR